MSAEMKEKRDLWEKLNNIPDSVMSQCIKLAKEIEKYQVPNVFSLLSKCDSDDIARLAKSPESSIASAYKQITSELDSEDAIVVLRHKLIESPIKIFGQLSGVMEGITYRIESCAERLEKSKTISRRFTLPYLVTLTYNERSITLECIFERLIGKTNSRNIKAHLLEIHKSVQASALMWLERGCKREDLVSGSGIAWRGNALAVMDLLQNHDTGKQFKLDTKLKPSFDGAFEKFDADLLPFVIELMQLHTDYTQTIQCKDSVAFVFKNDVSHVFKQKEGLFYADTSFKKDLLNEHIKTSLISI